MTEDEIDGLILIFNIINTLVNFLLFKVPEIYDLKSHIHKTF